MIDICIAAAANYKLLETQLDHWDWINGNYRILVCDNTPLQWRKTGWMKFHNHPVELYHQTYETLFDSERHGTALDFLVRKTNTEIIGICDTDFFWLSDIETDIMELFANGIRCVGAELWYPDFQLVNEKYPERAGWKAPCVFGMFLDRELALSETFVTTTSEGEELKETGWRLRRKIIEEHIPCHVYRAFQYHENPDKDIFYFGTPERPIGVHLLKGSTTRFYQAKDAYRVALEAAQKYIPKRIP